MNKIGKVYMITSPNNRVYIGSTVRELEDRWAYYYQLNCKAQIKLYNSLKKYGPKNHTFEKLWEGPISEMLQMEAILGIEWNVLHKDNLNCKIPKISDRYDTINEATRKKIGNASRNRTPETIQKLREAAKNRPKEVNERISRSLKGTKHNEQSRRNMGDSHLKCILQYDLSGNFIREWQSASEIESSMSIRQESIRRCCRRIRSKTGNFKWKYKTK